MPETKDSVDNLLRVSEVCEKLGIKRVTFYDLKERGILKVIDLNKDSGKRPRYRVLPQSLREYIKKQTIDKSSKN